MGALNNLYVSSSFQGLLKMTNSATGLTGTLQTIEAGDGSDSPLQMSLTQVNISGSFTINNLPITGSTSGTSGTSGSSGSSGSNGSSGTSGSSGSNGSSGTSGSSGSNGSSGTSGSDGLVGSNGSSGSSGTSGSSGSDGSSGTSGSNGSSGTSGSDGSSGTSGTSGSNGSDGTSGDSLFALTGSIWNTTNNVGITGSLTISGSQNIDLIVTGAAKVVNSTGLIELTMSPNSFNVNSTKSTFAAAGYIYGPTGSDAQFSLGVYDDPNFTTDVELNIKVDSSNGISFKDWDNVTAGDYVPFMSIAPNNGDNPAPQMLRGLGISGSLTDFGGNIYIAQSGQTVPFRITGSEAGGNIIMGYNDDRFVLQSQLTGSWSITGSNNIIMNGLIPDENYSADPGFKAYLSGSNNIIFGQPSTQNGILVNSSSVMLPTMNSNILGGYVNLGFTSSSLSKPTFSNNLSLSQTTFIQHPSGSLNMTNNTILGGLTSIATRTTLGLNTSIINNLFTNTTTLSHNSSSISYQGNLGGAISVTNNYSSSVSTAVNNITVGQNTFGGASNTLLVSGSNSGTRRTFTSNIIYGRSNEINSIYSGSFTGGHLVATAILGQNLIVSASHTSITSGGSTFVGRFNATGSLQESSADAVFVVGTGTGAGNRRNAIHIDSTNNIRITGSLLISGSATITGSLNAASITGSLQGTASFATNFDKTGLITTGSNTAGVGFSQVISGSLRITGSIFNRGAGNSDNNLAYGEEALPVNTTVGGGGYNNTALGYRTLYNNTTGQQNTAIGANTMLENVSGSNNVGIGDNALRNNRASTNLAIGTATLNQNTIGQGNTAIGVNAMTNNVSGSSNVAIGAGALQQSRNNNNIGIGGEALSNLTVGAFNTAIGNQAMANTISGSFNMAFGNEAGQFISGDNNVAIGYQSLKSTGGASRNIGIGIETLKNATGSANVAIGYQAGFNETGTNNFYIANQNYGSVTADRSGSLMYGKFDSTTANQTLQINAATDIRFGLKVSGTTNLTGSLLVSGDVQFASGSNKTIGTVALDGANPGVATVSNSLVTAASLIFLTKQTNNHPNAGPVVVSSKGTGTFTITSNHNGDTDTVAYQIINPIL